jgi:outer membrane receptor for ferrienterochelin and colicin
LLVQTTLAFTQKKTIVSGEIKDSQTLELLPYATLQIFSVPDSILIAGEIADDKGHFQIDGIKSGEYIIMASYMGYHRKIMKSVIHENINQFEILLISKNVTLDGVEITGDKSLIEKTIEKTTVNISENTTLSAGNALDAIQSLPSVDIDMDGKINYRGSDKVMILINGEKSELVKSLSQIPADRIEKIELINNPSARYEAEGMSGIINIVMKSGKSNTSKTTFMLNTGYPETFGGNAGYSGTRGRMQFYINGGANHKIGYQSKEHFRDNYENPDAFDYYQFDEQDDNQNNLFFNTDLDFKINQRHQFGISAMATKKFNTADREINYLTYDKSGIKTEESFKTIAIDLDNYSVDGNADYRYNFVKRGQYIKTGIYYSVFSQLQNQENRYFPDMTEINPEMQNTAAEQLNKVTDLSCDYVHPLSDSLFFESGYSYNMKDLLNDFSSGSFETDPGVWTNDTALASHFNYIQHIHAMYVNFNAKLRFIEIQAGLRGEYTLSEQNRNHGQDYYMLFPSVTLSKKLDSHHTIFAGYSRRINRPTIQMLNPYTEEYADILNMHKGNPDLQPEYVNSFEAGDRFVFDKWSAIGTFYYRNINNAISRIKSATDDSATTVTYMNLAKAVLYGGDFSLTYQPLKWWTINLNGNIFYTGLDGSYENNEVDNSRTAWNGSLSTQIKLPANAGIQVAAYYRSKLPSVTGVYQERYYVDAAVNKSIFKKKGRLVFSISDVFNTYKFGLDLDAADANNFRYSQTNRRKIESRYFILSFTYNITGKEQQKKTPKDNFYLDGFDK